MMHGYYLRTATSIDLLRTLPKTTLIAALAIASCQEPAPKPAIPPGANPLRWQEAIADFESQDREAPPPRGGVVFVGSSSIRLWQTLADDMAPTPVVHRGFGGSKLFDSIYYSEELVSKHDPSVVVVFSGTNDIAGNSPKSAVEVRDLALIGRGGSARDEARGVGEVSDAIVEHEIVIAA